MAQSKSMIFHLPKPFFYFSHIFLRGEVACIYVLPRDCETHVSLRGGLYPLNPTSMPFLDELVG